MILNKKLIETLTLLNDINKKFLNSKLRIYSSNRIFCNKFNFFSFLCMSKDFKKSPYSDIIINYFNKSEKLYPGSSFYLSQSIIAKLIQNKIYFENTVVIDKCLSNLEEYFKQNTSAYNKNLIKKILEFSGPNATLLCNSSEINEIRIKKTVNSLFNIDIHKDFADIYFKNTSQKTQNYIVSVMDVYIERESEIFTLLEHANKNKLPLLLICRGISDNAVRSLKLMILKNKMFVYPYIVKFENDDPFKLIDLSSTLGCEIVNVESGDSLYKNVVSKSSIKKLKLKWHQIEIFSPDKKLNVEINKSLLNCYDHDLKKYLLKRKKRISTNIVEILIPKKNIELLIEIKNLIKCYNSIAIFGLCRKNNKIYSSKSVNIVNTLTERLEDTIKNIGCIVIQKRE